MSSRNWKYEEIVDRFLDFSQQAQVNRDTRLPCRLTKSVSHKLISSCHVAKVQCDHCRRLNLSRPQGAPEIPCIVSPDVIRCAICCMAQVYRYDCCDNELKKLMLNSQDNRHTVSHHLYDRIGPHTHSMSANTSLPQRPPSSAQGVHTSDKATQAVRGLRDRIDRPPTSRDNASYHNEAVSRPTESRARNPNGAATDASRLSTARLDTKGSKSDPILSTVSPSNKKTEQTPANNHAPRPMPTKPTEKANPTALAETQKTVAVKKEEKDHQHIHSEPETATRSVMTANDSSTPHPELSSDTTKLETTDTPAEEGHSSSIDDSLEVKDSSLLKSADEKVMDRILRAITNLCGKSQGCACKARLEILIKENAKLRHENEELKRAEDLSRKRKERDFDRSQDECQKLRKTIQWCQKNMGQMIERLGSGGEDDREDVERTACQGSVA